MSSSTPQFPTPARKPYTRTFHGDAVEDPYYWLNDPSNPEVIDHLNAENSYHAARTAHLEELTEELFQGMKGYLKETDVQVPVRKGPFWYVARTTQGEQYPRWSRIPATGFAVPELPTDELLPEEQVYIDGPALAEGQEYFKVGGVLPSHDHRLVAYLVDVTGGERMQLRVIDAATGTLIDDGVRDVGYDLAFSADNRQVYYSRFDDAWRSYQIWSHTIGEDPATDTLIVEENDEKFRVGCGQSALGTHLIISAESTTSSEVQLLDLARPELGLQMVTPRQPNLEYSVEVAEDHLLIVHNHHREGFSLAVAPVGATSPEQWESLLDSGDGERIENVTLLRRAALVSMRSGGLPTVRVIPRREGRYAVEEMFDLGTGGPLDCVEESGNRHPDSPRVRYVVSSLARPSTVYEKDLETGETFTLKVQEVPGFDPNNYSEHRLWATAEDGTQVPISVICRAGTKPDGTHPGILYGYGSYEISVDPTFASSLLPLVDRGIIFAMAHIRGGGEMGRPWYLHGKFQEKKNTFTDFVSCAKHLQATGWVAPNKLAAYGGSAGGLLMGAVANLAPETFQAIHAAVPFVDALSTILDPSLPLTAGEWEEWGNPIDSKDVYEYMKSYTPYENIRACDYPAILATTSLNDIRVSYTEPAKWVARLRETVTNDFEKKPILLHCEMVAGHGGKSGRYESMRQRAGEYAFLIDLIENPRS